MTDQAGQNKSWLVAVLLGMIAPGLGHFYLGRRVKALVFFVCITLFSLFQTCQSSPEIVLFNAK